MLIDQIDFTVSHAATSCRRLFHGRGRCYPGLEHINIDWLAPVALIVLYREEEAAWLQELAQQLQDRLTGCSSVQVQYRCRPGAPYELLFGETVELTVVEEDGLRYQLVMGARQNYGLFLDMARGRQWVREHAQGRRVLNLFAYTCAFSVAALAGGAERVVNIDLSRASLSRGRENHRLNEQDTRKLVFESVDILKSFARLRKHGPYELLICDPPSLQKGSVDVRRDYPKLLRRIPEFMKPGSDLLLCLNAPHLAAEFLQQAVAEHCPDARFEGRLANPEVFCEADMERGLKVLHFTYLPD